MRLNEMSIVELRKLIVSYNPDLCTDDLIGWSQEEMIDEVIDLELETILDEVNVYKEIVSWEL